MKTLTFNGEIDNGNSGSGTVNIDWTAGARQKLTLTGNCTLTFTAPVGVGNFLLRLIQDATGSRTVTWPTIKWAGNSAPTLTTTALYHDDVAFYYYGSYDGQASLGFPP